MIVWTKHKCPTCDGAGFTGWSWGKLDTCSTCGGLGAWQTSEELRVNEPEDTHEISTGALR